MQIYSRTAIFLHWAIAIALAFQLAVGWSLESLGSKGFALYQLHKSVGILILVLTLLRIVTRIFKPRPVALEGGWEGALAKAVHFGLYGFMLFGPLTGWAMVSTEHVVIPTLLFGTIPLPHLPLPHSTNGFFDGSHALLGWIGLALFALHVAGAARHHLLLRDELVWRMVPGRSAAVMIALIVLVPAGFVAGGLLARQVGGGAAPSKADVAAKPVEPENVTLANATATDVASNAAVAENTTEAIAPVGPPPVWTVQPGGRIGFSVGNNGEAISGGFSRWTAKITMDPEHPETADIRVEIDLASAKVGDPTQNEMLPNDEFLGVAAHPRAIFTAKGATATGKNSYTARGTLNLKGVTKPQTIRFTLQGSGLKRSVTGTASIARNAFGVGNGDSSTGLDSNVALDFAFNATGKQP